jgi:glycosyltransferase involved in cell wall biosynthesis
LSRKTSVGIIYPADPLGSIPGGIDTCIKGILRYAPDDVSINIVGVTERPECYKLRTWHHIECDTGNYRFFPVLSVREGGKQKRFPLSLSFLFKLAYARLNAEFDILQFHRPEPAIRYYFANKPKILFSHTDMDVIYNSHSSIRWSYFPQLYFKLEDILFPTIDSFFIVHQQAVTKYIQRFRAIADRFNFLPTWVDTRIFYPASGSQRMDIRLRLFNGIGDPLHDKFAVFVGRLDSEKNPLMLLDSIALCLQQHPNLHLIMLGDGKLKKSVEHHIKLLKIDNRVHLIGLQPLDVVGKYLRASDLLVLSSAYEGMPRCVLEALGSGIPAVSTDVGEVRKLIIPGYNGEICKENCAESLAKSTIQCVKNISEYSGDRCLKSIEKYTPDRVLKPLFTTYHNLKRTYRGTHKA